MKISSACSVLSSVLLGSATAFAAQPSPSHAANTNIPKTHLSTPVSTHAAAPIVKKGSQASKPAVAASQTQDAPPAPAPAAAPAPKPVGVFEGYLKELTTDVPLTKDEQADIKSYYLDDGAKMQAILNNPALSPLQQTQQIDQLRDARNATIEALLPEAGRQQKFFEVEAKYRVALVVLAANGGLGSSTPSLAVPKPADTTPAPADKPTPAT